MGEGSGRREDGGEKINGRVNRGGAGGLALVDDLMGVNGWCNNMCPLVLLIFIREMPEQKEIGG